MDRVYNFSAGPAALPEPVLERAKEEMLDYGSSGMSVMEMSHRSSVFVEIASRAEANLRNLLKIGEDYFVLFLQGGARTVLRFPYEFGKSRRLDRLRFNRVMVAKSDC